MNFRWLLGIGACIAAVATFASATEYKNYVLVINGKLHQINLDEEIQIDTKDVDTLSIVLRKKAYSEFSDEFVAFQHRSAVGVSSTDIGDGVQQLISSTALGTLIMIQEYSEMNPDTLVSFMLAELTSDDVALGQKMTKGKVTYELKSGITVKGEKATLRFQGDEQYYEVLAHGKGNKGILIITLIDRDSLEPDKEMHERFWSSLELKF